MKATVEALIVVISMVTIRGDEAWGLAQPVSIALGATRKHRKA